MLHYSLWIVVQLKLAFKKLDEDDDDDQTKISTYSTAVVADGHGDSSSTAARTLASVNICFSARKTCWKSCLTIAKYIYRNIYFLDERERPRFPPAPAVAIFLRSGICEAIWASALSCLFFFAEKSIIRSNIEDWYMKNLRCGRAGWAKTRFAPAALTCWSSSSSSDSSSASSSSSSSLPPSPSAPLSFSSDCLVWSSLFFLSFAPSLLLGVTAASIWWISKA